MSIFASLPAPDDSQHEDDCAGWQVEGAVWEFVGPCSCGQPRSPLLYQGSHHLPAADDQRGGFVDLAQIPAHIRFYREHPDASPEEEPWTPPEPFLRFGVNSETVILPRAQVEEIHETLGGWLEATRPTDEQC